MRYFEIENTTEEKYNTIVMANTLGDAVDLHNEETLEGLMEEEFEEHGTSSISLNIIEITEDVAKLEFEKEESEYTLEEIFDGKPKVIRMKVVQ